MALFHVIRWVVLGQNWLRSTCLALQELIFPAPTATFHAHLRRMARLVAMRHRRRSRVYFHEATWPTALSR